MDFNFRSMFKNLFSNEKPKSTTRLQLLNGWNNYFCNWNGDIYNNSTVRASIDAIARFAAKLQISHVRFTDGKGTKINDALNSLLSTRPNPLMSTYDFLYKLVTLLYLHNNAFVYVQMVNSSIVALYPIDFNSSELREDSRGNVYVRFAFNGSYITVPYSSIIHIRRHFANNEFFGESVNTALQSELNNLLMLQQSLESAIKNSAKLQGYLQTVGTLTPKDQKRALEDFTSNINGAGFGVVDSKCEFKQLTNNYKYADNEAIEKAKTDIYNYFGISEKIVCGNFNETDYISFYESVIEPLAIQLGQEFTAKLFTERERGHGNEIKFAGNKLEYAALKDKVDLIKVIQQSAVCTINELRGILGFDPVEDGDVRTIKADYTTTDDNDITDNNIEDGDENEKGSQDEPDSNESAE